MAFWGLWVGLRTALPAAGSDARFQAKLVGGLEHPGFGTEGAPATDRQANRLDLGLGHRAVHKPGPIATTEERVLRHDRCLTGQSGPQARPGPVLGPGNQRRAEGVALDVARDGHEMFVVLDRERLEPALPDVSAMGIMPEIAPNVRRHQPLHPPREVAVAVGPQDEVEVVGHQAVGEQSHGQPQTRLADDAEEGLVVLRLVEDLGAGVAAIQDVVAKPALAGPPGARHSGLP